MTGRSAAVVGAGMSGLVAAHRFTAMLFPELEVQTAADCFDAPDELNRTVDTVNVRRCPQGLVHTRPGQADCSLPGYEPNCIVSCHGVHR